MAGRRRSFAGVAVGAAQFVKERSAAEHDRRTMIHSIVSQLAKGEASGTLPSGAAQGFLQTGQMPQLQAQPLLAGHQGGDLQSLVDSGEATISQTIKTPQGTITIKRGGAKQIDPALRANRVAMLQQRIGNMESQNAMAPMLAEQKRQQAFPSPTMGFGGFTDRPNILQKFFGTQQRPPLGTLPLQDTGFLRNQLTQLTTPTRREIASSGVSQSDLADLAQGIQAGMIRTQQEARDLITEAGLNPDDPSFADLLKQLP